MNGQPSFISHTSYYFSSCKRVDLVKERCENMIVNKWKLKRHFPYLFFTLFSRRIEPKRFEVNDHFNEDFKIAPILFL